MGLFDKFFSKKQMNTNLGADRDRQEQLGKSLKGQAVIQSPDEQQATRERMVAELDHQREGRLPKST